MSPMRSFLDVRRAVLLLLATLALSGCGGKQPATPTEPKDLPPEQKMRMADSYFRAGRVGEALELVQQAIAKEPERGTLHSRYGHYLFQAGRLADAEVALSTALELDPYLTDARNTLGAVYTTLQRYGDAEREFERALSDTAYPAPENIYLNLALLYDDQGRSTEAIDALRRAVEISPRFYRGHYELALQLESTGRLDEAAREFEVAEPAYREVGEYHYRRGFVYFRLGRREEAKEALERCLAVAPGSPSAAEAGDLLKVLN